MGCPVLLVAPDGEASRIVRCTDAGIVVPAERPTALASAVRVLCHDTDLLERLAMNSLLAAPQFSREKLARDMLNVFREIIPHRVLPEGFSPFSLTTEKQEP